MEEPYRFGEEIAQIALVPLQISRQDLLNSPWGRPNFFMFSFTVP